jgi:transglutaminase superfamily protein
MALGFGLVSLTGSLPANHSREILSGSSYSDTARTIQRMQDMVTLGKREFAVRKLIQQFIFNCPAKDYYCYCEAAHNFCRDKIRYVFDPNGVELIENPARILESRVADCDSIVILMATLCEQMGFPCRFVTIKADRERPEDFSHVFLEVRIPGRGWVGSDPTQPQRSFGWEPGSEYKRKNWPASKDSPETREGDDMAGLGNGNFGAIIRGVQSTPGVIVEKPWQFRNEEALITTNPEQMELATFGEGHAPMYTTPRPSFMYAPEAEELFAKEQEESAAPPPPVQGEVMSGMGQMRASEIPTWMLLAGAAGILFLMLRKKK